MLIRSSGQLAADIYLLTLGRSCHYVVGSPDKFYLFDPGLSAHVPMLLERMEEHRYQLKHCLGVIATHLHSDRIGSIPLLRRYHPTLPFIASPQMKQQLRQTEFLLALHREDTLLSNKFEISSPRTTISESEYVASFTVDRTISDSDHVALDENLSLRVLAFPGHTAESLGYLVEPYNFLIVDEGIGYYNARELPAPGADSSLELSVSSLRSFLEIELAGLCMPYFGTLTAQLVRKHIANVIQTSEDIRSETSRALAEGLSETEVSDHIQHSIYKSFAPDPLVSFNMNRSFQAVWQQLKPASND